MKTNKTQRRVPPPQKVRSAATNASKKRSAEKRGKSFKQRLAERPPKQRPIPADQQIEHPNRSETEKERSKFARLDFREQQKDGDRTADKIADPNKSILKEETEIQLQFLPGSVEQRSEKASIPPTAPIPPSDIDKIVTAIHVEETKNPIVFIDVKLASGNVRIELATRNRRTRIKLSTKCDKLRRKLQASKSELRDACSRSDIDATVTVTAK